MKKLELYKRYNREEIHDIFSPHTKFTPQSGTWGLHGLVRIENSNDFVFIVTLGTIQSGHTFDEGFTEDGVFRWQSQPRNTFKTPNIIKLINELKKGEKIVFCLRSRDENEELVDPNVLMFVALHELAHVMTKSIGHTKEFWDNFRILLRNAIKLNIYKRVNYNEKPVEYCGVKITDDPMNFD